MRLFIAISLPQNIKKLLANLQSDLKETNGDLKIRWVETENIHLTVQFIGSVEEEQATIVAKAVQQAVVGSTSFRLCLTKLAVFPSRTRPRVILVEMDGQLEIFKNLQKQVRHELRAAGFMDLPRAAAHVTLGRVKQPGALPLDKWTKLSEKYWQRAPEWEVVDVDLMQSILNRQGPVYHQLHSFKLGSG